MSDFYKCEHGSTLCGTCTRALKVQYTALQAERDRLKAELELQKETCQTGFKGRDAWKQKAEEWEAKYKQLDCEFDIDHMEMKQKAEKLAEALKRLAKSTPSSSIKECHEIIRRVVAIAQEALAEFEKGK